MNESNSLQFGIATSAPQAERLTEEDYEFIRKVTKILDNNEPSNALNILVESKDLDHFITPLSQIGLNIHAIRNLIQDLVLEGRFDEGVQMVREVIEVRVFGIDEDIVFEKYIKILKLLNFRLLRMSLNWNKIVKEVNYQPDYQQIKLYGKKIQLLLDNGIEPIITFSHFETRGFDLLDESFEKLFTRISSAVLNELIPIGVKYWLAFNEPGVHSGGTTLGFWGGEKLKFSIPKAIKLYWKHLENLKQFGKLSKEFYQNAHVIAERKNKEVKIIANFNVSIFDPGTSPTFFDKFCIWFADKVDKEAQIKPYEFEDGTHAFDILALNPYQVYNSAYTNRFLRSKLPKLFNKLTSLAAKLAAGAYMYGEGENLPEEITDIIESEVNIPDTANPDFFDSEETRFGNHGQILYPKGISLVIKQMREKYGKDEIALTESGADIFGSDHEGVRNKVWYIKKVKEELEKLNEEGITIPFVLIWTLIRMWEILGPEGGGIGTWDFGILAEPLSKDRITERLILDLEMDGDEARALAEQIEREGNTPLKIYKGMIENLGRIFASTEISAKQVVETLISSKGGGNELIINILQLLELKDYYAQFRDLKSLEVINLALQEALQRYAQKEFALEQ